MEQSSWIPRGRGLASVQSGSRIWIYELILISIRDLFVSFMVLPITAGCLITKRLYWWHFRFPSCSWELSGCMSEAGCLKPTITSVNELSNLCLFFSPIRSNDLFFSFSTNSKTHLINSFSLPRLTDFLIWLGLQRESGFLDFHFRSEALAPTFHGGCSPVA